MSQASCAIWLCHPQAKAISPWRGGPRMAEVIAAIAADSEGRGRTLAAAGAPSTPFPLRATRNPAAAAPSKPSCPTFPTTAAAGIGAHSAARRSRAPRWYTPKTIGSHSRRSPALTFRLGA